MPTPLGYQVTVLMDKVEEATQEKVGSFYIPEPSKKKFFISDDDVEKGTVLELGPLAFKGLVNGSSVEPWIKPGDRVWVKSYGGRRFKFKKSGQIIRQVNDEDLNCLIKPEEEEDELV